MRLPVIVISLAFATLLSGCAGPVGSLLSATATAISGVQYSMEDVVSRSYPASLEDVRKASQEAMAQLHIPLVEQESLASGMRLLGKAKDFPVIVDVERVTPVVTRVTVTAGNTYFTLDRATAQAVADRIGVVLERYALVETLS